MKQVECFYDGHAGRYESKFRVPFAGRIKRIEEEKILSFLFEQFSSFSKSKKLLEFGCGTGLFTLPMAEKGFEVTAVDISEGMLCELRTKLEAEAVTGITVVKADVEKFDGGGKLFDGVYGIGVLEYLRLPVNTVRRVASLLQPGGVAVFTAPAISVYGFCYWLTSLLRKQMRMNIFTRRSFERIFTDCGMELITIRSIGFHLPFMHPLTRIAAARLPSATPLQQTMF